MNMLILNELAEACDRRPIRRAKAGDASSQRLPNPQS